MRRLRDGKLDGRHVIGKTGEGGQVVTRIANQNPGEIWPPLPWDEWKDTCDTLHLWTQIVGKVKVRLSPFLNQLWHVAFHPTPRGLATGRIPYGHGVFAVQFDFIDHTVSITTSDGAVRVVPLMPRSVADFYREFMLTLRDLDVHVAITPRPDEIPDPIPFDQDDVHAAYDATSVQKWWGVTLQITTILDRYRSSFNGKSSPVLFWWGSFDLNTTRFSGRPAPLLQGVPRFMQLSEDQENFACGFWPGNVTASGVRLDEPMFFAYIYPEPTGFKEASVSPSSARYDERLGEFLLPYADARVSAAPDQTILSFFETAYSAAATLAKWDPALDSPRRRSSNPDRTGLP
jgi:hypothetical protein